MNVDMRISIKGDEALERKVARELADPLIRSHLTSFVAYHLSQAMVSLEWGSVVVGAKIEGLGNSSFFEGAGADPLDVVGGMQKPPTSSVGGSSKRGVP